MMRTPNALTIDVEFYHHAFSERNMPVDEQNLAYRDKGTEKLLGLLRSCHVKATFFVLGTFAERHPDIVRNIASDGHEIGVHSYSHKSVKQQSPEEFAKDLKMAKKAVEKASGQKAIGYRAPFFSFDESDSRYVKALVDAGFRYDSSTNPILKMLHGHPGNNPRFHRIKSQNKEFLELPLATLPLFGQRLPLAGGFYFRVMPYTIFKAGLHRINKTSGPAVLYLHNWEFDTAQPRLPGKLSVRFFHYAGLASTARKLMCLARDFELMPVNEFCRRTGISGS